MLEVLRRVHRGPPSEFGFYDIAFPDGVEVEFSASGLESQKSFFGCAFHIRGFGDDLIRFMFDVARAGEMVIIPAMEGNPFCLVSESQRAELPGDIAVRFPIVLLQDASELGLILARGFESWSAYRDHVMRKATGE